MDETVPVLDKLSVDKSFSYMQEDMGTGSLYQLINQFPIPYGASHHGTYKVQFKFSSWQITNSCKLHIQLMVVIFQ